MSTDVKIDDLFFVSMKDTHFGQMNQRVTKGLKKGISKSGVGVGVGVGVGGVGGVGGGGELRAVVVENSVLRIIDDYKPFLDINYHSVFDAYPSNDIPFIHFLIFVIWFVSPFQFPLQFFDLFSIYLHFKGFPFHSCLFHIKRSAKSENNG